MLWGIGKLRFCLRRLDAMRWLSGCPEVWRVTERRGYLAMNTGSRRYLFFPFIAEKKEPGNAAAFLLLYYPIKEGRILFFSLYFNPLALRALPLSHLR